MKGLNRKSNRKLAQRRAIIKIEEKEEIEREGMREEK